MNAIHITDRSLLRFADEVKAGFSFLEAIGFRCTRSEVTLVRFESAKIAIIVYHGRQSYEISLQIEDMRGSESYSFSQILRFVRNERAEQYRNYTTQTGVKRTARSPRKTFVYGIFSGLQGRHSLGFGGCVGR